MHGGQVLVKNFYRPRVESKSVAKKKLNEKNHFLADPEFFGGNGKNQVGPEASRFFATSGKNN